jgi:membrane protease YdiL (CAAX protease family)
VASPNEKAMNKAQILKSIAVIVSVLITYNFWTFLNYFSIVSVSVVENEYLDSFLFGLIQTAPVWVTSLLLFRKDAIRISGLTAPLLKGFGIAALSCIPLFLIFLFFFDFNESLNGHTIFNMALLAGIFEELVYRAFFFGALYGLLRWKFWPAVLVNAAIFSFGHLYQGYDFLSSLMTVLITGIGAVWFGWIYIRWNYNLWVPVFLHTLMNLSWHIFVVGDGTAAGGIASYVARALVIVVSVWLTLRYTSKMKPLTGPNQENVESPSVSSESRHPVSQVVTE